MNIASLPKHHAVLITSNNRKSLSESLFSELQVTSIASKIFDSTVLDIDTAKAIVAWAHTPYHENKTAILSFHAIGIEAQNAILKILEEPKPTVSFILITTDTSSLLRTVLSRVVQVKHETQDDQETYSTQLSSLANEFLRTAPVLRSKLPKVLELLAKTDEEGRKDRESVRMFILSLLFLLQKNNAAGLYIEETLLCAMYAQDPSASGKSLIEYLALLLPEVK